MNINLDCTIGSLMKDNKLLIFSGTAHPELTKKICNYLNLEIGKVQITRFPDQEVDIKVNSDVRGADVYILQPTCTPADSNLMELLALIDCCKRASAERVTAVIPYYGYARKDRKDEGRVPITAKLVANLLTAAGSDRILTVDLHAAQIQGFFDIPVDHLLARSIFLPYLSRLDITNLVMVSPDIGSVKQTRAYAKRLRVGMAVVDKRRDSPEEVTTFQLIGEVKNKNVVIIDDMISTATTIMEAYKLIKAQGALDVYFYATHPVLCSNAIENLRQCDVKEIVVSDSIPIPENKRLPNMKILSLASFLGEAIRRIHNSESISHLFESLNFEEFQ